MAKTNAWESALLQLLFNNTTAAGIGDTTGLVGSTGAGNLYVSLHTADPTVTGNQTSSEATYTSYARVAVVRTTSGWTVSGTTQVANTATVSFPQCTGGSNTITYVGVGTAALGAGELLYSGALSSSLAVSNNITPTFNSGQLVITES
jgi:hypothetical protein